MVIENLFSFGERKEFNMIPNNRLKTLNDHKYDVNGFDLLKLSSIYGANGAGKSNLVKSLQLFQALVVTEEIPVGFKNAQFKFNSGDNKKQVIAVEFVQDDIGFYYGIEILDGIVSTEELYLSGLGRKKDELLFERKTDKDRNSKILFLKAFEDDERSQLLKSVLLEELVKPNKPILKLISNRNNQFLKDVKKAFSWFQNTLQIITPELSPATLAHDIDIDAFFHQYAQNTMRSFNIGITSLTSEKVEIHEFFGDSDKDQLKQIIQHFEVSPDRILFTRDKNDIAIVKEEDKIWVKSLKVKHTGGNNKSVSFGLGEESDGTIRLLDFIPAFYELISEQKVFIIDEIERSIHPLLIKELVKKFSLDSQTKGQLIFTTHESNLLDQELFRRDEIWFAEKDESGSTDLYSLSDFKEHKTIDIRKGYLNGRYGSIPFLGNLQDLNWHQNDTD